MSRWFISFFLIVATCASYSQAKLLVKIKTNMSDSLTGEGSFYIFTKGQFSCKTSIFSDEIIYPIRDEMPRLFMVFFCLDENCKPTEFTYLNKSSLSETEKAKAEIKSEVKNAIEKYLLTKVSIEFELNGKTVDCKTGCKYLIKDTTVEIKSPSTTTESKCPINKLNIRFEIQ